MNMNLENNIDEIEADEAAYFEAFDYLVFGEDGCQIDEDED